MTEQAAASTLPVAALLSAAGGYLDAFTWIAHGHVFANAQTGNIVLLGVMLATEQWDQALRHIPPIVAFVLGVFTATWLRRHANQNRVRRQATISLVVEIVVLSLIAVFARRLPDFTVALCISYVAALQISSFRTIETWSYSSALTTGNLRTATEALFESFGPQRTEPDTRHARVFATICAMFAVGALAGGWLTGRLGDTALIGPVALLAIVLLLCLRRPEYGP